MPSPTEIAAALDALIVHYREGLEKATLLRNTVLGRVSGPAPTGAEKPKKQRARRVMTPELKAKIGANFRQRHLRKVS